MALKLLTLIVFFGVLMTTKLNAAQEQSDSSAPTKSNKNSQLEINQAKTKLENLNAEFIKIESASSNDDWPCKTVDKDYDKCSARETQKREQLDREKEKQKEMLNIQIGEILAQIFEVKSDFSFGEYNSSNQQLPIIFKNFSPAFLKISESEAQELKQNLAQIKTNAIVALQLNALNQAREYLLGARLSSSGKIYEVQTGEMNNAQAMRMFYGNYELKSKSSKWRFSARRLSEEKADLQDFKAEIVFSKQYLENGLERFVIVTSSFYDDCHACGALVGAANFVRQNGFWKFDGGQRYLGEYGTMGNPPEFLLRQIGPKKFALLMKSFFMGQGILSENITFWNQFGVIYKTVLSIGFSQDDSEAAPTPENEFSYTSQISYLPNQNSEYFDILVKSSGRKGVKVGQKYVVRPFAANRKYAFKADMYKLIEGKEFD